MAECVFCNIIRGDAAAQVLSRSERVVAILDINPIHFGHVLIIPRTHATTFVDVPKDELPELIHVVHVVSRAIVEAFHPPGFNIFSNNGKAAGQSIFHFHFHVTPRYEDDDIQFVVQRQVKVDKTLKAIDVYACDIHHNPPKLILEGTEKLRPRRRYYRENSDACQMDTPRFCRRCGLVARGSADRPAARRRGSPDPYGSTALPRVGP